ncbi:MAG: TrkH family potassium uptake protein [Acidimicrobiales bacterium]
MVKPRFKTGATSRGDALLDSSDRRIDSPLMHITGLTLLWVAGGVAISALVEFGYGDPDTSALLLSAAILGAVGYFLRRVSKVDRLDTAGAFAVVGWTWLIVSVAGALPYLLAGTFRYWDDAVFESVSGFSCTGSTVFGAYNDAISDQGHGILIYRQLTNWVGGMGIVLLALTVLPALGRGGLGLIGAEAPGPSSDQLVPRISEMAKRLWLLYQGMTALIATGFKVVGMGVYDAIAHSLAAAATGGFSPKDSSIGSFDSIAIEIVAMLAMIIGGMNFAVHNRALQGEPRAYFRDAETKMYLLWIAGAATLVVSLLWFDSALGFGDSLRSGLFNTVAIATSTGFGNATAAGSPGDFVTWIAGPQLVILILMMVGASTGSTSGGVKVMRIQILGRYVHRFLQGIRHRNLVLPVKIGGQRVKDHLVERVVGFMLLYSVIVFVGIVVVTALGADLMTAVGGVVGSLGNTGPALGDAGPTASFIDGYSRPARMVLAVLMLVGRLELFPMLLMLVVPRRIYRTVRPRKHF